MPINGIDANNPQPLIAASAEIITPGIDALVALRPQALAHINTNEGVYSHIFIGLRAQAAVALNYQTQLAIGKRLITDDRVDLDNLLASEFDVSIDLSATTALGQVTLTRSLGTFPPGVIRKGTGFNRTADTVGRPIPAQAAQYTSVEDVSVPSGATTIDVLVEASRAGLFANHVTNGQTTAVSVTTPLFDKNFAVSSFVATGGSDGVSPKEMRQIAKYSALGNSGATADAIRASALKFGARHIAVADRTDNGQLVVYALDGSWSASSVWNNRLDSFMRDDIAVGNGCMLAYRVTPNQYIHIAATVMLRDAALLVDTTEITAAIQAALRSYFDDRDDWYTWTSSGLKAAASRAHSSILVCTGVTVTDATTGSPVSQPPAILDGASNAVHYYLADNNCTISYTSIV